MKAIAPNATNTALSARTAPDPLISIWPVTSSVNANALKAYRAVTIHANATTTRFT